MLPRLNQEIYLKNAFIREIIDILIKKIEATIILCEHGQEENNFKTKYILDDHSVYLIMVKPLEMDRRGFVAPCIFGRDINPLKTKCSLL